MALQIRRGLEADRLSIVPAQAELLYTVDEKKLYIGDGSILGGNKISATSEEIQDLSAALLTTGIHSGITFTYDDAQNRINATVTGGGGGSGSDYTWAIAGDDSTSRIINNQETVKFSGVGGITVTTDTEGNVVITGGSGVVNAGAAGQLAYYNTIGTAVSPAFALFWDETSGTLTSPRVEANSIVTNSATFSIFNLNNETITFGGTLASVDYSGRLFTVDVGPYNSADPALSTMYQAMNTGNAHLLTFIKTRGTLNAPAAVQQFDATGGVSWTGYDGAGFARLGLISMIAATNPVAGSGIIPGIMVFQVADNAGIDTNVLFLENNQDATFFGNINASKSINNGTISINNNVISTTVSNADLELRTSGSGAILLDNISISMSEIKTVDSAGITFEPAVTFLSDVDIENDLRVDNKIYAAEFVSTSVGVPEISSATTIDLNAGTRTRVTGGVFRLNRITSVQRDAVIAENGDLIYNTTTNKFQGYENGAWVNLI